MIVLQKKLKCKYLGQYKSITFAPEKEKFRK